MRGNRQVKTAFLLLARYDALPVIPIATVAADFFPHLGVQKLLRKIAAGDIALPLVRMEGSAKTAKGVHLQDLAAYIDARAEDARKECLQLTGGGSGRCPTPPPFPPRGCGGPSRHRYPPPPRSSPSIGP